MEGRDMYKFTYKEKGNRPFVLYFNEKDNADSYAINHASIRKPSRKEEIATAVRGRGAFEGDSFSVIVEEIIPFDAVDERSDLNIA